MKFCGFFVTFDVDYEYEKNIKKSSFDYFYEFAPYFWAKIKNIDRIKISVGEKPE